MADGSAPTTADLARFGYFVIPLPPGRKFPPPIGWTETNSPYEIPEGANVGIRTRGELSILITNDEAATAWATKSFGGPNVRSPRGGHWYFRARPDQLNEPDRLTAVGRMENHVRNKFAVVPPSIHPTGVPYRWGIPLPPIDELRPAPDLEFLWHPPGTETTTANGGPRVVGAPTPAASDEEALRRTFEGPNGDIHRWVYESRLKGQHPKDHTGYVGFCTALYLAGAQDDQVPRILGFSPESWASFGRSIWNQLVRHGGYYRRRDTLVRVSNSYREALEALKLPEPPASTEPAEEGPSAEKCDPFVAFIAERYHPERVDTWHRLAVGMAGNKLGWTLAEIAGAVFAAYDLRGVAYDRPRITRVLTELFEEGKRPGRSGTAYRKNVAAAMLEAIDQFVEDHPDLIRGRTKRRTKDGPIPIAVAAPAAVLPKDLTPLSPETAVYHAVIADDGRPLTTVHLDPKHHLVSTRTFYETLGKERVPVEREVTVLVPEDFRPAVYVDEIDQRWVNWESRDGPVRGTIGDFANYLCHRYRIQSRYANGVPGWIGLLPVTGKVATRLSLNPPEEEGDVWNIPSTIYAKESGKFRDANAVVAGWYRARPRDYALGKLAELHRFVNTPNQRITLRFLAGAPIASKISPRRARAYLEAAGESLAGKTLTAQAIIAVLWALGAGPREYLDADAIGSEFRAEVWLSATDLPLLIDETTLELKQRRQLRRALSGGTGSRGQTTQLVSLLRLTAIPVLTSNIETVDTESAPAERHGNVRRRVYLPYDRSDVTAITGDIATEFAAFLASLNDGPIDPNGGGAALWLLRDLEAKDPGLASLRALDTNDRSDAQFVLDVGSALLGIESMQDPEKERGDEAGAEEMFLAWVRYTAARWVEVSNTRNSDQTLRFANDPVLSLVIVRGDHPKVPVRSLDEARTVWITNEALGAYDAKCRREGRTSPWRTIPSLRALAKVTGQEEDEIATVRQGHPKWFGHGQTGQTERVAVIDPWTYIRKVMSEADLEPSKPRTVDWREVNRESGTDL